MMFMYRLLNGATMDGMKIEMRPVIVSAGIIWYKLGQPYLGIVCGTNGNHSTLSLHPYGYAVDLETKHMAAAEAEQAADELRDNLLPEYDVVLHDTHIHAEWDAAKKLHY